jgi:hypothetical protein
MPLTTMIECDDYAFDKCRIVNVATRIPKHGVAQSCSAGSHSRYIRNSANCLLAVDHAFTAKSAAPGDRRYEHIQGHGTVLRCAQGLTGRQPLLGQCRAPRLVSPHARPVRPQ